MLHNNSNNKTKERKAKSELQSCRVAKLRQEWEENKLLVADPSFGGIKFKADVFNLNWPCCSC